jgi:hypothetical protein
LFCFLLFCSVLFCFVLFCFVLFCFVLFCFVLFCFVLLCCVSLCFVVFCFAMICFGVFRFVFLNPLFFSLLRYYVILFLFFGLSLHHISSHRISSIHSKRCPEIRAIPKQDNSCATQLQSQYHSMAIILTIARRNSSIYLYYPHTENNTDTRLQGGIQVFTCTIHTPRITLTLDCKEAFKYSLVLSTH